VMNPTEVLRVDRDLVASRSRNTPFHGMELPGRILATIFNGKTVFEGGNA
jgi:dihydroorotase